MSLPASNNGVRIGSGAAVTALRGVALCCAFGWLAACSSAPSRPPAPAPVVPSAAPVAAPAPAPATTNATAGAAAGAAAVVTPHPEVSLAARADFERAVNVMRAGNLNEAELEFKQIALQYPQYAAPLVNVAILKRKQGELPEAEQLLKSAVARESGNAIAWTELGATQSLRGEFKDAASSYQAAIAAEPRYAPAWRNLGVVQDLYLGDPHSALASLEQYKQLSGEDKPVSGWIAELRQRLGIAAVKPPAAQAPAADSAAPGAPAPNAAPAAPTPAKGGN
jgi:tetratricopeptide (TPR) repeat protein